MKYTPEEDAVILARYRRHPTCAIAEALGRSRNSIIGRVARLEGRQTDQRVRPQRDRPWDQRWARSPCRAPFEPDSSVPDFANDDDHIAAVMACGGYPVLHAGR